MLEATTRAAEIKSDGLVRRIRSFAAEHQAIRNGRATGVELPGNVWLSSEGEVFALPRALGDSRYPYGSNGLNFWVYASGYMHANDGLLSLFPRAQEGKEPPIAFLAGIPDGQGEYRPVSLMQVPRISQAPDADRCTVFTPSAAYFLCNIPPLHFGVRVFVEESRRICFSVLAKNLGGQSQRFLLSSFLNPFLRHQTHESDEDKWFKMVRVIGPAIEDRLAGYVIRVNEDRDRQPSLLNVAYVRRTATFLGEGRLLSDEATASRYQFVGGSLGSLHAPQALCRGTLGAPQHLCTFTEAGAAAGLSQIELGANSACRLDIEFSEAESEEEAFAKSVLIIDSPGIDKDAAEASRRDRRRHEKMSMSVSAPREGSLECGTFNSFMEMLKRQVEFCSLIKGYVQLATNSLIGVRDVYQALEALAIWRPSAAREKMLEAIEYMTPDGRFFRQYSLPSGEVSTSRMDLREFIDQGTWVITAFTTYVRVTGDFTILGEERGYHEIFNESSGSVRRSDLRDTVLEHLVRTMGFLLENRDLDHTGCVYALYGDWNDALDGLGRTERPGRKFGTGVSVMATLQVRQNTHEMVELLSSVDPVAYQEKIDEFRSAGEQLDDALREHAIVRSPDGSERRILHGWGDQRSYLIGGYEDADGESRDGLTALAYWVISGLHDSDPSMKDDLLAACDRMDSKYGLRTFAPHFEPGAPGVGRIGNLPAGTAENGAVYVHATAFGIMALFQMGEPERAWDQLMKVLPFTPGHERLSHSPFVLPNSYGYNPELGIDGESMNDWQTGSSNVVLKVLIRFVFGFEPRMDSLRIQPASWAPFDQFEFVAHYRNTRVRILYKRSGSEERSFLFNGALRSSIRDELLGTSVLQLPAGELDSLDEATIEVLA